MHQLDARIPIMPNTEAQAGNTLKLNAGLRHHRVSKICSFVPFLSVAIIGEEGLGRRPAATGIF